MATIRRRGGRWQAQVKRAGVRRSASFATRAAAETWARRIEGDVEQATALGLPPASRLPFRDALRAWEREHVPAGRVGARDRSRARTLDRALGTRPLADLDGRALEEYARGRLAEVGPQAVRHELGMISRVLQHAGLSPAAVQATRGRMKRRLSTRARSRRPAPGELGAILAHLSLPMAAIVCLLIETCMRRGEVAAMRRAHIRDKRFLRIPDTKTGHPRTVPLSAGALVALEEMGDGWGVAADSITQAWVRACRAAGVVDLHLHDLRHEGASRLFEGSTFGRPLSIPEAALVTGHRTWSQLQRYTQLTAESVLAASPATSPHPRSATPESDDQAR